MHRQLNQRTRVYLCELKIYIFYKFHTQCQIDGHSTLCKICFQLDFYMICMRIQRLSHLLFGCIWVGSFYSNTEMNIYMNSHTQIHNQTLQTYTMHGWTDVIGLNINNHCTRVPCQYGWTVKINTVQLTTLYLHPHIDISINEHLCFLNAQINSSHISDASPVLFLIINRHSIHTLVLKSHVGTCTCVAPSSNLSR